MSRPNGSAGFTLVELMILVVLLAIVAVIALPSFTSTIERNRVQAQAEELKSFLLYARGEAMSRKVVITAAIENDIWHIKHGGEELRQLENNPELVAIQASTDEIKFRSNGTATAATFTLCHNDNTVTGFHLEVQASGAIKLFRQGTKDADNTPLDSCTL